ncbi:MAG TPA: long-chain fatty acid--CoA ligase [Rhodopila sp.]|uniref:AMP-dependent synthetase/ligase n=1 Tax=Rhodopila sp. TaxID=2480087 RepID=UPI002CDDEC1A|nr:long-chain fatty acid--CoA ligase [Rhodopila sp.]HVY13865.1 long-chain fatty acid--CoA ligase [Rhodopila sp.]
MRTLTKIYPTWPNLAAMMFDRAHAWPEQAMLRVFRDGEWRGITWGAFGRMAASCARGLRAAGISAGDRVLLCAENRPEYPIAETALMAIRAVPVPAYTTNTEADQAHLLRDSGARVAIVSNADLAARIRAAAEPLGGLERLIVMDSPPAGTVAWDSLVADPRPFGDIAAEAALIPPTALACLIYTSGTGGAPRGVMLPHRCILSNCAGAFDLVRPLKLENETYLSYLPLSHSYEHTVGQFFLLSIGTEIVYCRGVEHLAADMLTVRPTLLTAVPRVLEVIRARVLTQVGREKPWRRALFDRALAIGLKRIDKTPLTLWERLLDLVLDRLVRSKVRARFGGRLIAAMSGGARLEPEVGRFFLALGIPIMQGYGQTEAGPVISANPPDAIRIDTVGTVLQGVDLKIAEDGEILVRGGLVMDGYWNRPEDTAAAIRDGWLHTGDIGELDRGYLRITDRKKDMIVLSGGENVSPAKIEGMLMAEAGIAQAVVAGDGRSGLCALLVPAEGYDDVAVAIAVNRTNMRLSVTERIRRHAIVPAFTVENGLLTPSQKIRRILVLRANAETLARLH